MFTEFYKIDFQIDKIKTFNILSLPLTYSNKSNFKAMKIIDGAMQLIFGKKSKPSKINKTCTNL